MSELLDILRQTGAIITDSHFVLTSGKHSATYINKDALYPHTEQTSRVCRLLADQVRHLEIDTVVGPALGGIILAQWTAHHLTQLQGREVVGVYTEKAPDGAQIITRGYDRFIIGKRVVIVEDLLTTGGSAKSALETIRRVGGDMVAVVAMVNRNRREITPEFFGTPFFPLETLDVEAYPEGACPLCNSAVPINTAVGHGKKYLERTGLRAV